MASALTATILNEKVIEKRIAALGPWFHNIRLGASKRRRNTFSATIRV